LRDSGEMLGDPRPITHAVKYYERGERPLEIVTSRQWFIRTLEHRSALLQRGRQITWHPAFMQSRYDDWVEGLNSDWLVSRQRFFGVPFPLWYRLDDRGEPLYDEPLVPDESRLPIDPTSDVPDGYAEDQRGRPGGFMADPDVLDTWATSSLTPQIAGRWEDDGDLWSRVFPMDLRPQGHDIIRTWLFTTVVRAHLEMESLPWSDTALSGWILDPDRKKMSKSKGNVVTPMDLLERHSSDAVRYWAGSARLGVDTAFDEGQMKIGRKLAIKLLNASKFVLGLGLVAGGSERGSAGGAAAVTEAVDRALLASLGELIETATTAFDGYDYARALEQTEAWFWSFCDDYVELVKARAYGETGERGAASARVTLAAALSVLVRLFAPVLAFTAEEVWSWWQDGSVHRAAWPSAGELPVGSGEAGDPTVLAAAVELLRAVRRSKTERGVSLRAPVAYLTVTATEERLRVFRSLEQDLRLAGAIAEIRWVAGSDEEPSIEVELAEAS
ncbi:MAG: class I tRNA ligase family protein, partial [Acidimicrobiaceae bacterium]|nr:class I tRNA ligase family protein [Acidimicrobiaceae bacterium]